MIEIYKFVYIYMSILLPIVDGTGIRKPCHE